MFEARKKLRWAELKVGLLITVALAIILATMLFAVGLGTLFTRRVTLHARFDDVKGLRHGAPVWLSGIEAGKVSAISLGKERGVRVELAIEERWLPYVPEGSTASIQTQGMLGDRYVAIRRGPVEAPAVEPGAVLESEPELDLSEVLQSGTRSIARMGAILDRVDELVSRLQMSQGSLSLLVEDPSLYTNLSDAASELQATLGSLNSSSGSLQRLIADPGLYDNLDRASRELLDLLATLRSGRSAAGNLVTDPIMARQLGASVDELHETLREARTLLQAIRANPEKYFKFSIF